jgi:hypothetical protein
MKVHSRSVESGVSDQHLTSPEGEPEEEKQVEACESTFSDAMKGLVAARIYICQSDTKNSVTVMRYKLKLICTD